MEYKIRLNSMFYEIIFSNITFSKVFSAQTSFNNEEIMAIQIKVKELINLQMPQLMKFLPYYEDVKVQSIIKISDDLKKRFKTIIMVGMGGALLNSVALDSFLSNKSDLEVIFCDKLCHKYIEKIRSSINLETTCFIFISNSGETIETLTIAEYWYESLKNKELDDFNKRFIFIYNSKTSSLLKNFHKKTGGIFLEYDSLMGGRFATFTTPYILLTNLKGYNCKSFFDGANYVLEAFISGNNELTKGIILGSLLTAFGLISNNFSKNIINASYDSIFDGIIRWYSTALSETLGKDDVKFSPINLNLPVDQHGIVQALLTNKSYQQLNLFCIKEQIENSKLTKVQNMLQDELCCQFDNYSIPVRKIILKDSNESTYGAIMMHLILETITAALLIGVDPFTQPQIDNIKRNLAADYRKQYVP